MCPGEDTSDAAQVVEVSNGKMVIRSIADGGGHTIDRAHPVGKAIRECLRLRER
jgi:hypothetical protein